MYMCAIRTIDTISYSYNLPNTCVLSSQCLKPHLVFHVCSNVSMASMSRFLVGSSLSAESKQLESMTNKMAVTLSNTCIHFRRSPRCPPTSNTLKRREQINAHLCITSPNLMLWAIGIDRVGDKTACTHKKLSAIFLSVPNVSTKMLAEF